MARRKQMQEVGGGGGRCTDHRHHRQEFGCSPNSSVGALTAHCAGAGQCPSGRCLGHRSELQNDEHIFTWNGSAISHGSSNPLSLLPVPAAPSDTCTS